MVNSTRSAWRACTVHVANRRPADVAVVSKSIGTWGSPARTNSQWTDNGVGRSEAMPRAAATRAWPIAIPPNTRRRRPGGANPRNVVGASRSRLSADSHSSIAAPMLITIEPYFGMGGSTLPLPSPRSLLSHIMNWLSTYRSSSSPRAAIADR